jgi:hypothetical protein
MDPLFLSCSRQWQAFGLGNNNAGRDSDGVNNPNAIGNARCVILSSHMMYFWEIDLFTQEHTQ